MRHKLILGFAHWGTTNVPVIQMIETVQLAVKLGIEEFDCAPHYGNGAQENVLGVAIASLPFEDRVRLKVSTKVGRVIETFMSVHSYGQSTNGFNNHSGFAQAYDYTEEGIVQSIHQSRLRLQQSNFDRLFIHDLDKQTHGDNYERRKNQLLQEKGLSNLGNMQELGEVRQIGLGSNDANSTIDLIKACGKDIDVVMIAGCYNLLNTSALDELFPLCLQQKMELHIAAPYGGGLLSGQEGNVSFRYKDASPELLTKLEKIKTICKQFEIELPHAAMQFVHMHPQVTKVVVGARTPQELQKSYHYAITPIKKAFWQALMDAELIPRIEVPDVLEEGIGFFENAGGNDDTRLHNSIKPR